MKITHRNNRSISHRIVLMAQPSRWENNYSPSKFTVIKFLNLLNDSKVMHGRLNQIAI